MAGNRYRDDRDGYGSHPDDHYLSWRDGQIQQMDRDYEDYCRESRESFHTDFDNWRRNRQSQGGSGLGTSASTGSSATTGGSGESGNPRADALTGSVNEGGIDGVGMETTAESATDAES